MGYKEDRGPESNESSKETDTLDSLNIGAIKSSEGTDGYVLGHVVRMRKKGAKRGYVEYYRPFDIDGSEGKRWKFGLRNMTTQMMPIHYLCFEKYS